MARDDRRQGAEDCAAASDLHRRPRQGLPANRSALVGTSTLVATWTLTVRAGPKVERRRFDALEPALDALAARVAELAASTKDHPPDIKLRRYGPEQQVAGRIEISGPERRLAGVHAGVDVRGDGSTVAYLGRVRRRPLDLAGDEDATAAIRRTLINR